MKLARAYGIARGGSQKLGIVGFDRGFHGRTLGAQQAGGLASQKSWIVNLDPAIINAPFADGYWQEDTRFDSFLESLAKAQLKPENVAGVMMETYQGVGPDFAPVDYVCQLSQWCKQNEVVLVFDEVQAGFGRTGRFWGFDHYGVTPDLICCGKGISSSLPLSAVIGRSQIMDQFAPGSMTSTHTGNPVCCAAALANIRKLVKQNLAANAARLGPSLLEGLQRIQRKHPQLVGRVSARGLVGGLQAVIAGRKEPNPDLAHSIVEKCFQRGLLLFAPVGAWGQTVKIAPPLTTPAEALIDGLRVLDESVDEAVKECPAGLTQKLSD
jgi:4-aminobutyrate aminotransferase-like enzyme